MNFWLCGVEVVVILERIKHPRAHGYNLMNIDLLCCRLCLYPSSPIPPAQHEAMLKSPSLLSAYGQNPTKRVSLTVRWEDYKLKYHFSYGSIAWGLIHCPQTELLSSSSSSSSRDQNFVTDALVNLQSVEKYAQSIIHARRQLCEKLSLSHL